MGRFKFLGGIALVGICIGFVAQDAHAISAWARRYNTRCDMCHWQLNKLNKFGQEFLHRGHRLPNEGAKENEGYASIDKYLSFTSKIRYKDQNRNEPTFDIEAFSLYMGGPLSENYSFFVEQYLHESQTAGADREKLADAYLHYKSTGDEKYATLRAGQIQPYLMMTHGTGPRLAVSRPMLLNDVTVGSNPYRPRQRQYGAEAGYVMEDIGLRGYLGIVNGTGHTPANINQDNNSYKDQYLTLEKVIDKKGSNIGLYGYNGRYPISSGNNVTFQDNFWQGGLTGEYVFNDKFSVFGVGLLGENRRSNGTDRDSYGAFLEGNYRIIDDLAAFARYDYFDPDKDASRDFTRGSSIGLSHWLTDFARITGEVQSKDSATTTSDNYWLELQFMY